MTNFNTKSLREELAQALSRTIDDSRGIAVYGAGDTAERNIAPIMGEFGSGGGLQYFIDDTLAKHGKLFHGKPIVNLKEAHELCKGFLILICSDLGKNRKIMAGSLRQDPVEGAENFTTLDDYVFCRHAEEILSVYDMLEDDLSKAVYANMILTRMARAEQDQTLVNERTYYGVPEFTTADPSEVYVDCGAYTGDTVEQYLSERKNVFHKIFAFEPSESNFRELDDCVTRLKREWSISDDRIELAQAGIGERSCQIEPALSADSVNIGYTLSGGSVVDAGGIPVVSIDERFSNQPVSFLKADIEGYEWKMLCGAEQVIRRDKPKMAICIYHSTYDMYRIAQKVKAIYPDYKLSVRQHSHDILDTVLYAYI